MYKNQKILGWIGLLSLLALQNCRTEDINLPDASTVTASLSVSPTTVAETNGTGTVKVSLNNYAFAPTTIYLNFTGTATEGTDYTVSSPSVTIPVGAKEGTVTVKSLPDAFFEDDETVIISIESADHAVSSGTSATMRIKEGLSANPLVLNEVLYDPSNSGLKGDANGDGVYNQDQDEFVELVNNSTSPLDISGYKIFDTTGLTSNTPRHIFPAGTVLQGGKAVVVFGGGKPTGSFGGSIVQTASAGLLNLNNDADIVTVTDASGKTLQTFDIAPLSHNPDESYTRNPDLTGAFVQHSTVVKGRLFSPGMKVDLTNF